MAVPPDVIGGETITSEWGNDIRDWATSSIAFAGTVENSSVATTSTLTAGATVSFVPHATWGTYQMMAWGEAVLTQNTGSASSGQTRIGIGVDVWGLSDHRGDCCEWCSNHRARFPLPDSYFRDVECVAPIPSRFRRYDQVRYDHPLHRYPSHIGGGSVMAEAKKPSKPRAPAVLDQAAAAELLGITEAELVRSRMRGLPPGTLGVRGPDGLLVWKKKDLAAHTNEAGEEG